MKDQFTINFSDQNVEEQTLKLLEEYGVLIVKGFLGKPEVDALLKEYETVLQTNDKAIQDLNYPQGIGKRIEFNQLSKEKFPETVRTFNHPYMIKVAEQYLGIPNHFNHEIYVARDEHEEINDLNMMHYDKLSTLKFFLYLNDIDRSNGAFEAVPRSHKIAQKIMNFYSKRGKKIKNLPNRELPDTLNEGVAMEAPAGSLIVFTTDTYHRAGRVEKGKYRKIMRGHSRKHPMPKYAPSLFSRQWFNESPINPARYYYAISDKLSKEKTH
jgi:hypothetical protein